MILKSYLANIKVIEGDHFVTIQKRVVPILSGIQVKIEDLNSGVCGDIIKIPDQKKTTEFLINYVDINEYGEMIHSIYGFQLDFGMLYTLKTYPPKVVEIIPNTEEDFDTVRTETSWAEDKLNLTEKERKKHNLKRYGIRGNSHE